jgi:hypothetical protein
MSLADAEREELQEYRKRDLLQRMRTISKEHWDAGWRRGLEHDLYLMTFHGVPSEYGMGMVAPDALAALKRLSELTRVWWARSEGVDAPSSIPLAEAEQRFSKLAAEDDGGGVHALSIPDLQQLYRQSTADHWQYEVVQPIMRGMPAWHVYRMRSNPLVALFLRDDGRWELRFGDTTAEYVQPAWAKQL